MAIIRVEKQRNFVAIDKTCLEDDRLSFKAKGLHSYLMSRPDNWKPILEQLSTVSKDKQASVRAGMKELEDCGYIIRRPVKDNGKIVEWEHIVYEKPQKPSLSPQVGFPQVEIPQVEIPQVENRRLISNEVINNDLISNEVINLLSAAADDPPPKYDTDSEPYKLAHYLREQILSRDPQTKVPANTLEALQSWSKDADRMIRLDHRDFAEAKELIKWCQKDSFWSSNILSMATFRKQYDKLKRQSGGKQKYDPTTVDWEAEAAKYLP